MKNIFTILFLTATLFMQSQSINYNQPLPDNPRFVKGVLENGMTYYIYKTEAVKDAASYYIISNAGSILEDDNQSGLAHFLEHMAFNGTKNFPDKGILTTLQKYGALFGRDINAYTAFDETIYNMDNIPTKDHMVDTCLLILHDWANEISLLDEEIDNERGVIKEEWRSRRNGNMRILERSLPAMFVGTKYANRLPIGSMDIVENFKYEELRQFYHDWYRTDLQAIAIIGDVNVEEVEKKIKKIFSPIPAVTNPKERIVVTIPENKEMLFFLGTDKEVSTSLIRYSIHFPKSLKKQTVGDLHTIILQDLFISMINARLQELIQKADTPFTYVNFGIDGLSRTENNLSLIIAPKPNKQYEAFEIALKEVERAVKYGFTKEEFSRIILSMKKRYEMQISQLESLPHMSIKEVIKNNYLENKTLTDIAAEYEIAKKIFDNITPEDVQNRLKSLYTEKNRVMLVTGVEGNRNLNKADALQIIDKVKNDRSLKPYKESFTGTDLMDSIEVKKGKIVSEKQIDEIGATLFELSNGVKVYYKYADKDKNQVQLVADSEGGMSLVSIEDLPSASFVATLVGGSGVANYSNTDLAKLLAGKTVSSSIKINDINELLLGYSDTKDVETMLQLNYLRFVKPRFDKESFDVMIHDLQNSLIEKKNNIQSKMADSLTVALYGKSNPKKPLLSEEYISKISLEKIEKIYKERFKDPSDFNFFIIGDVKKEDLKPLLEKYIASIPSYKTKENWKDSYVPWQKNSIDRDIFLKMEIPKSTVRMEFENDIKWSLKNKYLINTIKDILQLRLDKTLREEEGGTYGAQVYGGLVKRPREYARLGIAFDCNPELAEKLITIVHKEIEKIKNGAIENEDLSKTLSNYAKIENQAKNSNAFYLDQVYTYIKDGYNVADEKNTLLIFNNITVNDIKEFANKFFANDRNYEIVFKPKK